MKKIGFEYLDNSLKPLFKNGLEKKVFSGAAVAVFYKEKGEEKTHIQPFGKTKNESGGEKVSKNTFFDLASLTKPLCTTLSILSLIEKKELDRGDCIKDLINDKKGSGLKNISVEQLLSHSSGLIDYRPFFKGFEPLPSKNTKKKIIEAIFQEPLAYNPGEKCMYSDLGYILLGKIIENVSGKSLDKYFKKNITRPLQLERSIFFRSLWSAKKKKITDIAATERCRWRKKLLQGEVHDEHSWLMGGIAGHAGLFGTAGGVLSLLKNILHLWQGREEHPAYSSMLLQKAIGWKRENETWAMGFDRPSPKDSSAGNFFSPSSIGHLGYTGTSFWIDPEKELIVVLLTNRIHLTRKNERIKQFRPVFHNTVVETLGIK